MSLKNIKKAPIEIAQLLAQNSKIINLLFNDSGDALNGNSSITINELIKDKYIIFYPPVDNYQDKDRNTFLVILLDSVSFSENTRGNVTIYVTTDKDHILLTDNKNRLLELADEIVNTLDKQKITSAGELNVTNISHVMLSEFRAGYRISLNFSDQNTYKVTL